MKESETKKWKLLIKVNDVDDLLSLDDFVLELFEFNRADIEEEDDLEKYIDSLIEFDDCRNYLNGDRNTIFDDIEWEKEGYKMKLYRTARRTDHDIFPSEIVNFEIYVDENK